MILFFDFVVAEISGDPFLIYTSSNGELIWILLPLIPTLLIAFEYPFNQIPFDWRMIFFPIILFSFYLLLNLVIVAIQPVQGHIYEDFDWFHAPGFAILSTLASFLLLTIAFAIMWCITQKYKLPKYQNRTEKKFDNYVSDIKKKKTGEES